MTIIVDVGSGREREKNYQAEPAKDAAGCCQGATSLLLEILLLFSYRENRGPGPNDKLTCSVPQTAQWLAIVRVASWALHTVCPSRHSAGQ